MAVVASSGIAALSRGSGTVIQRSTRVFNRSNIFWLNGPVVPSAIVSGVTETGPPVSKTRFHIS